MCRLNAARQWHCAFEILAMSSGRQLKAGYSCLQTPKTDVPQGGIGSSMLFAEDSTLGPEPLLWASPKRFGDPANSKVSTSLEPCFLCFHHDRHETGMAAL